MAVVTPETSRADAAVWLERLQRAWRDRDPDGFAALFADDAVYHAGPFSDPHRGRAAIRAHWAATLARQAERPEFWFGPPHSDGLRASVEWWCVLRAPDTGAPRTAAGCLVLEFAGDGRCRRFHEYFHAAFDAALTPPAGWFA